MSEPSFALGSLVRAVAQRVPGERDAIVCGDRRVSWREFDERATRFAGVLAGRGLGRRPEAGECDSGHDHVGLMLDNGPEYLEAMIGASRAGAAALGVSTRFSAPETAALLTALDVRLLVVAARCARVAEAAIAQVEEAPQVIVVGEGPAPAAWARYELALGRLVEQPVLAARPTDRVVICTGGTTGTPKAVMWPSEAFFASSLRGHEVLEPGVDAAGAIDRLLAQSPPRSLAPTPVSHFAAQAVALQALVRGGTALLLPTDRRFDADAFVDLAEAGRATDGLIIGEVTARPIVERLRARGAALPHLRWLLAGSTLLSASTKRDLITLVDGLEIRDSMGSSETGMQAVALARADAIDDAFTPLRGNVVLTDEGRPAAPGEIGQIARTADLSLGYYRNPTATAELWREGPDGPYATTGDLVRARANGTFQLLGRGSMTINSGGEKIFVQEVEAALAALSEITACLVVGADAPVWGREVRALVVWTGDPLDDEQLRARLTPVLARYKHPKRVHALTRLPHLANGKPDYAAAERLVREADAPATARVDA